MRELLKDCLNYFTVETDLKKRIKAELAKPNEPLAWLSIDSRDNHHVHLDKMPDKTLKEWNVKQQLPLYTHPPAQQKPLSDGEIAKYFFHPIQNLGTALAFARAIERRVRGE